MASIYTNTNISFLNRKQARVAAINTGVLTPSSKHDLTVTKDALITAVKAK